MGAGKTTYTYYAAKAGYLKYLCRGYHIADVGDCADHILRKYDICIGGGCEAPDEIDEKLLEDSIYVGDEDIPRLNNEIRSIAEGRRKKFKMLFLDDILAMGLYHMGGVYKQLYLWFTRNVQLIRTIAKVTIMTTHSIDLIPRPLQKALAIIVAHADFNGTNFTYNSLKVTLLARGQADSVPLLRHYLARRTAEEPSLQTANLARREDREEEEGDDLDIRAHA